VTPTVAGGWSTALTIPSDAAFATNPATFPLQGYAGLPPQPVFFPVSVSFPSQLVGAPESTQIVWLDGGLHPAALGTQRLEISSAAIGGPDATSFRVAWDGCSGLAIDPAYSGPVAVEFNPRAGHPLNERGSSRTGVLTQSSEERSFVGSCWLSLDKTLDSDRATQIIA
jgi:hypothetical protein